MGDREIHSQRIDAVVRELSTDLDKGLTQEEARERLQKFGPNELTESPGRDSSRCCGISSTTTW